LEESSYSFQILNRMARQKTRKRVAALRRKRRRTRQRGGSNDSRTVEWKTPKNDNGMVEVDAVAHLASKV